MAHINAVPISGNRDAIVDYEWHIEPDGSRLAITVCVSHDTRSGLTAEDQTDILQAVQEAIRHFEP